MHRGLCVEITRDLADIAVKIAEYSQANDDRTPRSVWSDCRTLFLRNQPIFEFAEFSDIFKIEDAEEEEEGEEQEDVNIRKKTEDEATTYHKFRIKNGEERRDEEETKDAQLTGSRKGRQVEDKQRLKLLQLELDRQRVLADADFENYRDFAAPWDEFVPTRGGQVEEDEAEEIFRLGRVVLGYVVHRLLGMLYNQPTEIMARSAPRVKVAAVVLDITSAALLDELRELLKRYDVHLLRMGDAINHCLERYKREMADVEYIDLDIVSATARDVGRLQAEGKTNGSKGRRAKLPERPMAKNAAAKQRQNATGEKQTQTPRQIPYDDLHPTLSDAAYIGVIFSDILSSVHTLTVHLALEVVV